MNNSNNKGAEGCLMFWKRALSASSALQGLVSYKPVSCKKVVYHSQGHTIVGDGTTAQLTAMLTGVPESKNPEARRGWKNAGPVDKWPFIYYDLKKRDYVTTFSEDEHGAGTFHMRLHGKNTYRCGARVQFFL